MSRLHSTLAGQRRRFAAVRSFRQWIRGVAPRTISRIALAAAVLGVVFSGVLVIPGFRHSHAGGNRPHGHGHRHVHGTHSHDKSHSHGHTHAHGSAHDHEHHHHHHHHAHDDQHLHYHAAHDSSSINAAPHEHIHISILGFTFTQFDGPASSADETSTDELNDSGDSRRALQASAGESTLARTHLRPSSTSLFMEWLRAWESSPVPRGIQAPDDYGLFARHSLQDDRSVEVCSKPPLPPPRAA